MTQEKIRSHLDQKARDFLYIFDDSIREKLEGNFYFAGGCIYSLANDKTPKDYDIFLYDDTLIPLLGDLDIWSYISEYALSYGKFQIVVKYFGEPTDCVGEFDFRHNMYYYIPFTNEIKTANEDEQNYKNFRYIHTNELFFNEGRARDIEGVFLRVNKFVKRGMTITKEEKRKIKKRTTRKAVKAYKKKRGSKANFSY